MKLSRRNLIKAAGALGATLVLPDVVEAEERRKYWFLDQRHVGIREFYHIFGRMERPINLTGLHGNKPDFHADVTYDSAGWNDIAWEVEQVMMGDGTPLYRARIIPNALLNAGEIHPDFMSALPWMSPSEAKSHGIIIQRG